MAEGGSEPDRCAFHREVGTTAEAVDVEARTASRIGWLSVPRSSAGAGPGSVLAMQHGRSWARDASWSFPFGSGAPAQHPEPAWEAGAAWA